MLAKIQVIRHRVELWRIVFRKGRMSILAMKAFLEAINHSFPVEASFIRYASPVGKLGEVHSICELLKASKVFLERERIH